MLADSGVNRGATSGLGQKETNDVEDSITGYGDNGDNDSVGFDDNSQVGVDKDSATEDEDSGPELENSNGECCGIS